MFNKYEDYISTLPDKREYTKDEILTDRFMLYKEDMLSIYYAPHNEYINDYAEILVLGICPGWTQMKMAYQSVHQSVSLGNLSDESILKKAKIDSRLWGTTRTNLVSMFNEIGLPERLHLSSSGCLFDASNLILHTTSLIKYPVFVAGMKNYNGYFPAINNNDSLYFYCKTYLTEELDNLHNLKMVIPLGRIVEYTFLHLFPSYNEITIKNFPHPSGINGSRLKQFATYKEQISLQVRSLYKN